MSSGLIRSIDRSSSEGRFKAPFDLWPFPNMGLAKVVWYASGPYWGCFSKDGLLEGIVADDVGLLGFPGTAV